MTGNTEILKLQKNYRNSKLQKFQNYRNFKITEKLQKNYRNSKLQKFQNYKNFKITEILKLQIYSLPSVDTCPSLPLSPCVTALFTFILLSFLLSSYCPFYFHLIVLFISISLFFLFPSQCSFWRGLGLREA